MGGESLLLTALRSPLLRILCLKLFWIEQKGRLFFAGKRESICDDWESDI